MRSLDFLCPALLALSLSSEAYAGRKSSNSALLSTVKTLTLRKDLSTTHRRVSAIPQLRCVGGSAKGLYEVDIMRCKNQGSDYDDENIQWTCTASLPPEFKLGSTDVICEGYDSPRDPYVLKGSCGVEYRLILTEKGEEKYGRRGSLWRDYKREGIDWVSGLSWLCLMGVAGWMIYAAFFTSQRPGWRPAGDNNPRRWGWGGGGGGGGGNDPPPPYDWQPPRKTQTRAPAGQQEGWRPGFWSGALGGAAAGYLAGNRAQNQQRSRAWVPYDNAGEGSSRMGPSGSRSRSDPSPSSARYESTGFGSTSRR